MFTNLPEEIERIIWKFYYSNYIVEAISKINSVWHTPSNDLVDICKDKGCIQHGHTDMEKILLSYQGDFVEVVHDTCFKNICLNCVYHGFPCLNACYHGGFDTKLEGIWNMDFYK